MPRKAFIADLKSVSEQNIFGITDVIRGDDDGSVYATYTPASGAPIEIELMVQPDVGSYPLECFYMIFSRSIVVPNGVGDVLSDVAESSAGLTIAAVLANLSSKLQRHLAAGTVDDSGRVHSDLDPMDVDPDFDQESDEESEDEFYGESDQDDFGLEGINGSNIATASPFKLNPENAARIERRIKDDLRAVRFAGFKIGVLIGMRADSVHSLLSLSIQVLKLGLSDEAMQAWDLEPQQYIIVLVRYSNGYKSFDSIIDDAAKSLDVTFRVGIGNKYKPTIPEALAAFSEISKDCKKAQDGGSADEPPEKLDAGFSNIFISSSLNELINTRFISLLKIRNSLGVGWDGAKSYFNDKEGRMDHSAELASQYYVESTPANMALPDLVTSDHLTDHQAKNISFPLIAVQFAIRYLTRCTEFCLVCHDKIKEDFEALKPYVCEKPLCLYQYMNLGFGPSVEHEILTQPYVVDLLVSFCYTAAMSRRIREYPIGMSLAVPEVLTYTTTAAPRGYHMGNPPPGDSPLHVEIPEEHVVKYDNSRHEVIFESTNNISPVRKGDWVIVTSSAQFHYKVEDVSYYPTVHLSKIPVPRKLTSPTEGETPRVAVTPDTPSVTPPPVSLNVARLTIYNKNFDEMEDIAKAETIATLLETLPSIKEMRARLLQQSRQTQPSLRSWNDRISPAALGLLRWIIASNRSCIVQVDKCPGQEDVEVALSKIHLEQRVSNISTDWVQFRFAQGSPDKEQRFLNALREQQSNLNLKYPTLFAFHGSPLPNWHSIIRTGLDFKETLHGRAFGHGVYHAQDQNTSIGYAQPNNVVWHGSDLKISSAMSLNEIVNFPGEYASKQPHLVVQHIDWIQCRYLMVQAQGNSSYTNGYSSYPGRSNSGEISRDSDPLCEVEQDPSYQARSTLNKVIGVPFCAASISRAFIETNGETNSSKRRKSNRSSHQLTSLQHITSDSEDQHDLAFLLSDDENQERNTRKPATKLNTTLKTLTDFIPGSLDQSKLPMMQQPEYATPMATKALNRALKDILEVQNKTPLHELGWYIDAELIDNVYQWIVELHSFDPDLPLSKDMKSTGTTSIVMEIRFPKDYPFSPPFLRVIRPRFLPFTMGGGGHVTAGGAMCMELLTTSGWSAVSSIEGVLLQVRLAISNTEPRPARLEGQGKRQAIADYSVGEAMAAYIRACNTHGWKVPDSFQEFASGAGSFTDYE